MYCRNCGENLGLKHECPDCHTLAGDGNQYCPHCGSKVSAWASKCPQCDTSFIAKEVLEARELNGHSKLSMALLAFFLGCWGIHCFVMGEPKKGMLRIILTLVCGIGRIVALIDMVMIIIGRYEYNPEGYLW